MVGKAPFDAVAKFYDRDFTDTWLGQKLRRHVRRRIEPYLEPGMRVLELGCGTGEDTIWMARKGLHVTATDFSAEMLDIARSKADLEGLDEPPDFEILNIEAPAGNGDFGPGFDLVWANFGVLNCIESRAPLAHWLDRAVRPDGLVAVTLMGRWCLWEILWFLAHGKGRSAFRRLRDGKTARLGRNSKIRVWYPSPRRLRNEFRPEFKIVARYGIGTLLPPTYLARMTVRWPRLFGYLADLDYWLAPYPPFWRFADHYLAIFSKAE